MSERFDLDRETALELAHAISELRGAVDGLARGLAGGRSWADDFDLYSDWPNPATSQNFRTEPDLAVAIWNRYAVDVDVIHAGSEKPVAHVAAGKLVVQNMPVLGLVITAAAQPAQNAAKLRVVRYERPQTVGVWVI